MLGGGVFAVLPLQAATVGPWLPLAVGTAAIPAACNAWASAACGRVFPNAAGTFGFARELGAPGWSWVAGGTFVLSKCAAGATALLAVGEMGAGLVGNDGPISPVVAAWVILAVLLGLNLAGVRRAVTALAVLAGSFLLSILWFVGSAVVRPPEVSTALSGAPPTTGVFLAASATLFFAYTGYARLATLGNLVRDPERTIPRAVTASLVVVLAVYASVGAVLGRWLPAGAPNLAVAARDLGLGPVSVALGVTGFAAIAGVVLSQIQGVARVASVMGEAIGTGAAASRERSAMVGTAGVMAVLIAIGDLSLAAKVTVASILVYYAITNAVALKLPRRQFPRFVGALGFTACTGLLLALLAR